MPAQYEALLVDRVDAVLIITMNRPERRNALNRTLERDLVHALRLAQNDASIRAVVLTGAGKGFCAGADLMSFGGRLTGEQAREHILTAYWPIVELLVTMPKPVIGAINGVAAGAGCSLALACDLLVMADDASLLQAFSNIALVPDAGSSWFLAQQVGYHRAYQIAIEGERLPAETCAHLGLANKVVPANNLLPEATAWAASLAQRPTLALGLTKRTMQAAMTTTLEETVRLEADLQARCFDSQDHAEGLQAFLEKREPQFTGQ